MGWFSYTEDDDKKHDVWGFANPGKAPGQSGGLFDSVWSGGGQEDRDKKQQNDDSHSDDGDKPYDAMSGLFG